MFEPISARFASSCSRNGISAADTPTVCFGEMSTKSIPSAGTCRRSPNIRPSSVPSLIRAGLRRPSPFCRCARNSSFATTGGRRLPSFSDSTTSGGASVAFISWSARRYTMSPLTLPFATFRYGVMRKPYSSTEL